MLHQIKIKLRNLLKKRIFMIATGSFGGILFLFHYIYMVEIIRQFTRINSCSPLTGQRKLFSNNYHNHTVPNVFDVSNIKFIINGKPCSKHSMIFLTVCIISKSSNFQQRDTIRKTWASDSMNDQIHFIFIVGESKVSYENKQIEKESLQEKDIVLVDFADSYRNLSFKSVSMLKWSSLFCSSSKYILKIDDDIFVDIPALFGMLKYIYTPKSIIGFLIPVSFPDRRITSKWFVSTDDYMDDLYPPYISGFSYAISSDLLKGLLEAASKSHVLPIEDIYITGICGYKAGATLIGHCGFNHYQIPVNHWSRNTVSLMSHKYIPADMQKLWDMKHSLFGANNSWFYHILQMSV